MNQREIKFRGLDKKNKWRYGYYWSWSNDHWIREKRCDGGYEDFLIDIKTLGQYIGLKDKNGKGNEVYEGDLIQENPSGYEPRLVYKVYWNNNLLTWCLKDKDGNVCGLWSFTRDFKVIGNIWENKDLL